MSPPRDKHLLISNRNLMDFCPCFAYFWNSCDSHYLSLLFSGCDKTQSPKIIQGVNSLFDTYVVTVHQPGQPWQWPKFGNWRLGTDARNRGMLLSGFPSVLLSFFLSFTIQDHDDPPTVSQHSHINHQLRKCTPHCPQANLRKAIPQLMFILTKWL